MTSPYLDRPLFPLAIALPRMLKQIEIDLATAGPAETLRLGQRAELIRELLKPRRSPTPRDRDRGRPLGSPSSGVGSQAGFDGAR